MSSLQNPAPAPACTTQLSLTWPNCTCRHRRTGAVALVALITGLFFVSASAQSVYRSVAADGSVVFTDQPSTTATPTRPLDTAAQDTPSDGPALPFVLQQVADKYPVTLYTALDCAACDSGRNLLQGRGVPFTEKTISTQEDMDALQSLAGSGSLPLLTIGAQHVRGYSAQEWGQYLSAAGYPQHSQLPQGWRHRTATPLVRLQQPGPAVQAASASQPASKLPAMPARPERVNPANPAGIAF